jgi:hypothetical protein
MRRSEIRERRCMMLRAATDCATAKGPSLHPGYAS